MTFGFEGYCQMCGEQDAFGRYVTIDGESVGFCSHCANRYDVDEGEKGRYHLDKCKECGHIKEIRWVPYKVRGTSKGLKPLPVPKNKVLDGYAEEHATPPA